MASELLAITKAKDLCSYILTVTVKSPKQFRFSLVSRLHGYSLEVIEKAYRANEVYVSGGDKSAREKRLAFQHEALTALKLLSYLSQLSMEQGCILPKQYEQISKKVSDCQNLLGAWINSDRKRTGV